MPLQLYHAMVAKAKTLSDVVSLLCVDSETWLTMPVAPTLQPPVRLFTQSTCRHRMRSFRKTPSPPPSASPLPSPRYRPWLPAPPGLGFFGREFCLLEAQLEVLL